MAMHGIRLLLLHGVVHAWVLNSALPNTTDYVNHFDIPPGTRGLPWRSTDELFNLSQAHTPYSAV